MKKYFLYVRQSIRWSILFIVIVNIIHYLHARKFYEYDWYFIAIPVDLLLAGPLYAVAIKKFNR